MKNEELEVRVYVGTYAKYNNGSIFGEWLTITEDTDMSEFWRQCKELHKDEEDPEYMIQDYEVPAMLTGMVSECHISYDIPEALKALSLADNDIEVYEAFADIMGKYDDIESLISDADEAYLGKWYSDEEFAENMAEECGMLEKDPAWPYTCIDWELAARELMYDYSESNGHYFRSV